MIEVTNLNIYWIMKYLPIILILWIPLIVLIVQCIRWNSKDEYGSYGFGMFWGFSIAALFVLEMGCIYKYKSIYEHDPKVMDVYQGKTTIEYTIRDGVKVDSIVVFKENYDWSNRTTK